MIQRGSRILTTHTGSLPRPKDLAAMLQDREEGRSCPEPAFQARVRAAVFDVVKKQAETALSVVNDGEQGRADYTVYVKDRLTGFEGESAPLPNRAAMERDIQNLKDATAGAAAGHTLADVGFGTFAGRVQVDTNIVWHKLRSLVEGARRASDELW